MSELKTLKDFEAYYDSEGYVIEYAVKKDELRQEAIKWIIEDMNDFDLNHNPGVCYIINKWIKRFNLTEKDFK